MNKIKLKLEQAFPFPPYESQLQLAADIYTSLANVRKVSIYESPTGTGKSYATIAGIMTYLSDEKSGKTIKENQKYEITQSDLPDWFNDFEIKGDIKKSVQKNSINNKKQKKIQLIDDENEFNYSSQDESQLNRKINLKTLSKKQIQIVYCSRTHSQIKQWISEVKNSEFRYQIVSLASRQQLCCNSAILKRSNNNLNRLNHICKQEKKNCIYYKAYQKWTEDNNNDFQQELLDIEDLYNEGIKCNTCPYYVSKALVEYSDIICVPYQLLLDNIDKLNKPSIVVDEAHNFGTAMLQSQSSVVNSKCLQVVINGLEMYRKKYHQRVKAKTLYYLQILYKTCQNLLNSAQKVRNEIKLLDFMLEIGLGKVQINKFIKFVKNKEMRRRIGGFIDTCQQVQSYSNLDIICGFIDTLITANQNEALLYIDQNQTIKLSFINNISSFQTLVDKCASLIFLGGTLQPLNEFEEFRNRVSNQYDFTFKEYPHIISKERCKLIIINAKLEYSLKVKQEQNNHLLDQTKIILDQIINIVPKGVVVFFQSFQFLNQFKDYIEKERVSFRKKLLFDNKQQNIFTTYSQSVQQGAVLFSVVGGSMSEGINFSDDLARAVVIFGVPFPNLDSPELKEQIKRNGNTYYENITMRAVNQCIGRVIRHKNDYGLLFLVDRRFSDKVIQEKLSAWLKERITVTNEFEGTDFFTKLN